MSSEKDTRRVSETYRGIAKETSPSNLDDRVMAMARDEARTRYGLARAWIRPVAWAATIGLSFAFILEMTYFGDTVPPVDEAVPVPVDEALPAAVDDDANEAGREAEPAAEAPAFKQTLPSVVAAPEIRARQTPALREAEERADAAARYSADSPAEDPRSERASPEFATSADGCDAADRESADGWYRCVLALRAQGLEDAAEAELAALREAFPDFREPVSE